VEMAIYNPNVRAQASIGFDIGGSFGSTKAAEQFGDAYGYYIWLPSVPNDPWAAATTEQWNTYWIQQNSVYWPLLVMKDVGTSVREERGDPEAIPSSYTLRQNYPNPFNPATMISYALPHAGHVTLSVYNVLGQTVGTLVDGQRAAGTHTLSWSADNLSSGVYIYELTVDGKVVAAKKMMLVR